MNEEEDDLSVFNECFSSRDYILFYGTLIKYKGLCEIADAAHDILSRYENLHIGIIGDGDYHLIDLIKHNAGEDSNRIIYHSAIGFSALKPIIKMLWQSCFPH